MLPTGYQLRIGLRKEKSLLIEFMEKTYQEIFPEENNFSHLAYTVDSHLLNSTPLWWVEETQERSKPVACLWMGNAVDQRNGKRYTHIFLLYVAPEHRHQGIGKALMLKAEQWAKQRGDCQIGLQVFSHNIPAINLYQSLGFQTQSWLMIKLFNSKQ